MSQQMYHYGLGRRKTAIAKIRLYPGSGTVVVNGKPMEEVFHRDVHRRVIEQPLRVTENWGKYNVQAVVRGGGVTGWAGAMSHGIARALVVADDRHRATLRRHGLLTRDAREKERKKYGLKRARKAPQYTKR
ncbi:MAG TPA: 30S ribosomal protein S9 [Dehalococcoidia bacterium]|nr:30S ribosomal protein S9 [Dehalococcoidia bacterium]